MMRIISSLILLLFLLHACGPSASETDRSSADNPMEIATTADTKSPSLLEKHEPELFAEEGMVSFDIDVIFGGKTRLNGQVLWSTDSRLGRITTAGGDSIYIKDDQVWHNGNEDQNSQVRFAAYTWSYFFLLPYKIDDPGVRLIPMSRTADHPAGQMIYEMRFEEGVGDAPDDWYILHLGEDDGLLDLAAYIVTAGQSIEEAEKDPHSIEYLNYIEVNGIPMAHEWKFWEWRKEEGNTRQLGSARLKNIEFDVLDKAKFNVPPHFIEAKP